MATIKIAIITSALLLAPGLAPSPALAQSNPVPFISQPLSPATVAPGTANFTLTVTGAGFSPSSVVDWNGSPRTTQYLSTTQLTAMILASDVALPTSGAVSVVTPAPGGGRSNTTLLEVAISRKTLSFNLSTLTGKSGPSFVAAADVNTDGFLDLVITDPVANVVSVFPGNGDGTFQARADYPVSGAPFAAAIADINGDGIPDIVTADQSGEISVLLGNGGGTFQTAVNYPANGVPVSIALADFNRDGKLDVVVANYSGGFLASVLLGNGDGTFKPPAGYGAGTNNTSVAIGDFNGDGKLDLAVTQSAGTSGVNILLGKGDGTFGSPKFTNTDSGAQSVAVADFNHDGKADLAVACNTSGTVDILLGNGNGTFQAAVAYPTGPMPFSVALGDVNGDGFLDLVTANLGGNSVSVLAGKGNGAFLARHDFLVKGGTVTSVAVADLNRDGLPDIVGAATTGPVSVLLQTTVVFNPNNLPFGQQPLGTSSAPMTVTLTNTASVTLDITGITIGGSDPADFSQTSTCGSTVNPGASCTISVTFAPQAGGSRSAALTITDSAPDSPQTVPLSGVGLTAMVMFSPASLTFPTQVVFTTSASQTVMLTNTGMASLSITNITTTGDFSQTNNCGANVAIGASCMISVFFRPQTKGAQSGSVKVTDNAPASPQAVTLSGTGTYVSLLPASLTFAGQKVGTTSPAQKIILTNKDSVALSIGGITITGANAADFAQKNKCGSSVAANSSCTISVTFTPKAKGSRAAIVSISDNGGGSPQLVPVTGTGT